MPWLLLALVLAGVSGCSRAASETLGPVDALSPTALVASPDGKFLYIACAGANRVMVFDTAGNKATRHFTVSAAPSGLALSSDGRRLVVTCSGAVSPVVVLDAATGKVLQRFEAGHTALSPVFGPGETNLFVCNRFNNEIAIYDLSPGGEPARIPVPREPVSAALTRDGRFLVVANHLPSGRSDVPYVSAAVTVIDVVARKAVKNLRLANGSINLREVRVSPDGHHAAVVHTIARFNVPVTQIHRGWVNTSALTLIDLQKLEVLGAVLLDDPDRGAADPWAVSWTADNKTLGITHAGTHELSVIPFDDLLKKVHARAAATPRESLPLVLQNLETRSNPVPLATDLSFLTGLRRRVKLHSNGLRSLAIVKDQAYVAGYFSDTLERVALTGADPGFTTQGAHSQVPPDQLIRLRSESKAVQADLPRTFPFAARRADRVPSEASAATRLGEQYFNDATLCFQGWQSCATCHDNDARVDGVNWDLLNDGIGNPKDTKSLVLSHQTPPVMSLGVRATAEVAVRSGIVNSLASVVPEDVPNAIDEWLKSLQPMPSPYLVKGQLSPRAREGQKIFQSAAVACASCHASDLFTDLRSYTVGTENEFDRGQKDFDTPTLRELWRTGPYLHDGSAATIRDVLTSRNAKDEHGKTSHLSASEIEALAEYVLSL